MKSEKYVLFHKLSEPYAIERVNLVALAERNKLTIVKARPLLVTVEASSEQINAVELENPLVSIARQTAQQMAIPLANEALEHYRSVPLFVRNVSEAAK